MLQLSIPTSQGLAVFHSVIGLAYDAASGDMRCHVHMRGTEDGRVIWEEYPTVPVSALAGDGTPLENAEKFLSTADGMFNGAVFTTAGQEDTLEVARDKKTKQVNNTFSEKAANLTSGYPSAEQQTWPMQQAEALAWDANNSTPTPFLDDIATARGDDLVEFRTKVLGNARLFLTESATLMGQRQKLRDQILAAETVEGVNAIQWPAE